MREFQGYVVSLLATLSRVWRGGIPFYLSIVRSTDCIICCCHTVCSEYRAGGLKKKYTSWLSRRKIKVGDRGIIIIPQILKPSSCTLNIPPFALDIFLRIGDMIPGCLIGGQTEHKGKIAGLPQAATDNGATNDGSEIKLWEDPSRRFGGSVT